MLVEKTETGVSVHLSVSEAAELTERLRLDEGRRDFGSDLKYCLVTVLSGKQEKSAL